MNVPDFIHILQNANPVLSPQQTRELEAIIEEYPFFQAARALHLKGLQHLDSHKYPNALKVTAAYTADREVLFHYMTSGDLAQHTIAAAIVPQTLELEEKKSLSEVPELLQNITETSNSSLSQCKQDDFEAANLEVLPPPRDVVSFAKREKHSFMKWLQLTDTMTGEEPEKTVEALDKKKKFALLDKFIESNSKIVPKEGVTPKINIEASTKIDKNELMTETLAKVYVEQKKYKKAIQAYTILRLKYPEKSGFFADQIRAVQQLQKENE